MVFMGSRNPGVANINVPHFLDVLNSVDNEDDSSVISLSCIVLPQSQPRRYFDQEKLDKLKESIKEHGILQPLLVRPLEAEIYELVAGERRYRAAYEAGLDEVPVIIRELDRNKAYQFSLIENLQREDLNPVEETESILELLCLELDITSKEVISIIDQVLNAKKRNLDLTENNFSQFEKIEFILSTTSKLTAESFRTARLPLLNLPQEILEVLRQGKIEYTKARAVARVKDEKKRKSLLKKVIAENLSLSQIKERIAKLKTGHVKDKGIKGDYTAMYSQRLKDVYTKVKKIKSWSDLQKQQEFESLLSKLENLL